MLDIEIVTVRTRNDLKEFVNLPWSIYHSQDNWVPPLKEISEGSWIQKSILFGNLLNVNSLLQRKTDKRLEE